jgi:hypothetical protein
MIRVGTVLCLMVKRRLNNAKRRGLLFHELRKKEPAGGKVLDLPIETSEFQIGKSDEKDSGKHLIYDVTSH